ASLKPGGQAWGLWKSTHGEANWTFLFYAGTTTQGCNPPNNGGTNACSARGVNKVELDPRDSNIVYAAAFGRGLFRSDDAGATWRQIFTPEVPQFVPPYVNDTTDRTEFAVTKLPNGKVRIYAGDGSVGPSG